MKLSRDSEGVFTPPAVRQWIAEQQGDLYDYVKATELIRQFSENLLLQISSKNWHHTSCPMHTWKRHKK